ncbi:MAG TPA: aminotransferase class III-fold pyridoxal phosphate-dependent enzyme [Polyangiaceae bacterium]
MRDGGLDEREAFGRYARPRVAELLAAIGLDVVYHRGAGDYLYYRDEQGRDVRVLDMLGGYGASLFGHNHPELVARLREALDCERPFNAQASVRGHAGVLARRLSKLVSASTGRAYVTTFASTEAEAVEAALRPWQRWGVHAF